MKIILFSILASILVIAAVIGVYFYVNSQQDVPETYTSTDKEECQRIEFLCIEGYERFDDDLGCGCRPKVSCTKESKLCPDGSYVGRQGPDCEFTICPSDIQHKCLPEQRNAELCTQDLTPVCGYVQVECFRAPCNPVPQTFNNECYACSNERVQYWIEGSCQTAK